jgi:hypothetical protein
MWSLRSETQTFRVSNTYIIRSMIHPENAIYYILHFFSLDLDFCFLLYCQKLFIYMIASQKGEANNRIRRKIKSISLLDLSFKYICNLQCKTYNCKILGPLSIGMGYGILFYLFTNKPIILHQCVIKQISLYKTLI